MLMPEMINLESAGLRHSARVASQPRTKYNFFLALIRFCAFGSLIATILSQPMAEFSHGQATINAAVHQCNVINANFDGALNEIHHMVLASGKVNNENYIFRGMLKEDDASDFIKAMIKETQDHESRGHWEIIKRSSIPHGVKQFRQYGLSKGNDSQMAR